MSETDLLKSKSAAANQPQQTRILVESLVGSGIINSLRNHPSIRVVTKDELRSNPDFFFLPNRAKSFWKPMVRAQPWANFPRLTACRVRLLCAQKRGAK